MARQLGRIRDVTGAAQFEQPDFRRTKKSHWDSRGTHTRTRISLQRFVLPYPPCIGSGTVRIDNNRPNKWQTDLPTMCMAAEIEIDPGFLRLLDNLWGVYEQDFKGFRRDIFEGCR